MGLQRRMTMEAEDPHLLRDYVLLADGWRGCMANPVGELSWLCFPTWADPAVFSGLLGSAGHYSIGPRERCVHGGYYEDGSLIWRQRWVTSDGLVEVREAMAYPGRPDKAIILRRVESIDADISMRASLSLSSDYGRGPVARWERDRHAWRVRTGPVFARWIGADRATSDPSGALVSDVHLHPGDRHDFVLELSTQEVDPHDTLEPDELWRMTEAAWKDQVPRCEAVAGGDDVRRAFAVLRGMTTPTGATVAAATTSLPERAEAGRNYDYRYCWVRDTCYVGHAGAAVKGAEQVLDGAVRWIAERLLSDGPNTTPAYQIDGSAVPKQTHLGIPGYPGGDDIVGNRVRTQFQLDLFGEALVLLARAAKLDRLDADGWRAAEIAVQSIEERHAEPEAGIWEVDPRLWTHSRLICVAGLKAIAERGGPKGPTTQALTLADRLLSEADRTSLHPTGRWQRAPDDDRVDASLLLSQIRGATAPDDPRSIATRQAILAELCQEGFLYRYAEPGEPLGSNEGAFTICNFWMAMAKLGAGEITQGAQWFERTRSACGSSGLFSEEYDVAQRQLRGNIPQAFVHAVLIETAAQLANA